MGDSERDGLAIARERIAREREERTGYLDLGMLSLTELPEELFELQHLRALNLGRPFGQEEIAWQTNRTVYTQSEIIVTSLPSGGIIPCRAGGLNIPTAFYRRERHSVTVIFGANSFESLEGLACLPTLECLALRGCVLTTLSGISGLQLIVALDCSETNVSDPSPLAALNSLQDIDFSLTQIDSLDALAGLHNLRYLWADWTRISNIDPLSGLSMLQSISFCTTAVRDISPLSRFSNLQEIYAHQTQIDDLKPLSRLYGLEVISVGRTLVDDVNPISDRRKIRILDLRYTNVTNITSLINMSCLTALNLSNCTLDYFPRDLLKKPSLQVLHLHGAHIPGVPDEVLSQNLYENCLHALRAHYADLASGTVDLPDVKVMVLGNCRVGKTQLCRWLRGEPYDETIPSTHGIEVSSALLTEAAAEFAAKLNIWDFGGQDIYHGTHTLFMSSRSIFVLAWTPLTESQGEQLHDGVIFRNYPLAYWIRCVRYMGGTSSAVVVLQTCCDRPEDEDHYPLAEAELFNEFNFRRVRHFSAKERRGTESLAESLRDAVSWLRGHDNQAVIGAGRYRVQQRLEAMRDADAALPSADRQHRTITQEEFRQLCDEAGGISSGEHLLSYLHNAGIVIHLPGLLDDKIVLDQAWVLNAMYTVFDEEKCSKWIRRLHGRFTRTDLEDWVWRGHNVDDQELFLRMMQSCGICFAHRRFGLEDGEAEYIAPDLLPERATLEVELAQKWDPALPKETVTFSYAMLHPRLIRNIISRIGSEAGIDAEYWKGGVYIYETGTGSRALIEEKVLHNWQGEITIQTQRGQAALLRQRLTTLVKEEQNRAGITPQSISPNSFHEAAYTAAASAGAAANLFFGQEPSPFPERYISYAWGDATPDGRRLDEIVDRLCTEAEKRGRRIVRDKDALRMGERISKFMTLLAHGEKIVIILSDKYLRSANCMFELLEIWKNCGQNADEFNRRTCVHPLECAKIWKLEDQIHYTKYWQDQYEGIGRRVKNVEVSPEQYQQYKRIGYFKEHIGAILATITDTLQPLSFDELKKCIFDDDSGES